MLFQFALKTALIVGAALAAMYFGFAAKAAPTSGRIIVVYNAIGHDGPSVRPNRRAVHQQ
jgi:hypothetical protein